MAIVGHVPLVWKVSDNFVLVVVSGIGFLFSTVGETVRNVSLFLSA